MSLTKTFSMTLPNGITVTRESKRDYAFACAVKSPKSGWFCGGFSATVKGANALGSIFRNEGGSLTVVVPATALVA